MLRLDEELSNIIGEIKDVEKREVKIGWSEEINITDFDSALNLWIVDKERRNLSNETIKIGKRKVKSFINFMGKLDISSPDEVTPNDVEKFFASRKRNPNATGFPTHYGQLKNFFNYLLTLGAIQENPVTKIKFKKGKQNGFKFLEPDNEYKFIGSFNTRKNIDCRNLLIVQLMLNCGLSVGEISKLKINDINHNNRSLTIDGKWTSRITNIDTSTFKTLTIYMTSDLYGKSGWVFSSSDINGKQLLKESIQKIIYRHSIRNFPEREAISYRVLKNTFVMKHLRCGGNGKTIAALMGVRASRMIDKLLERV